MLKSVHYDFSKTNKIVKSAPNILIVDDSDSNIAFLEIVFRELNVNIITAESGLQALEKVKKHKISLALIDIIMPNMNGFELAMKINEDKSLKNIPVLFITASYSSKEIITEGFKCGAVDFLFKPFDIQLLISKIKMFLELFTYQEQLLQSEKILSEKQNILNEAQSLAHVGSWKWDLSSNTALWSDEMYRIFDLNPDTYDDKPESLLKIIHPDDKDSFAKNMEENIQSGNTTPLEYRIIRSDGEVRTIFAKGRTIFNTEGIHTEIVGTVMDITERKRAEETLTASKEYLHKIINTAASPIFVKDDKHNFCLVNDAFCTLLNLPEEKIINTTGYDYFPKEQLRVFFAKDQEVFNTGEENINEEFLTDGMGKIRTIVTRKTLYTDLSGNKFLVGVINDITDRKQIENKLRESEELFKSVVYNSSDLTTLTDDNGVLTYISPQCENVLGFPKDKFIGKTMPDIIHPDDRIKVKQAWEQVLLKSEHLREFEYRIIDDEGKVRLVSHSAKMILHNNKILGMQSTIRNVTERKLVEEALIKSEEIYRTLLKASPDGIVVANMEGVITDVSEMALEIYGTNDSADLIGRNIWELFPADSIDKAKDVVNRTLTEGIVQNVEIFLATKKHSPIITEISITLIQDQTGSPMSFMITVRDISNRKKIEKQKMHTERMVALGEMATGIAHEINQPLNNMSLVLDNVMLEYSKEKTIDESYFKLKSEKIYKNIDRIKNIIENFRLFTRADNQEIFSTFSINNSILEAISIVYEQVRNRNINIETQLEDNIPFINGNSYKFEQVMLNLILNAKDALVEKRDTLQENYTMVIDITTYTESGSLVIKVHDNGTGIKSEDIDNIMLPFYTTKEEGKGTGLGLSISYGIVRELNGTIDIETAISEGTTIKITLPVNN